MVAESLFTQSLVDGLILGLVYAVAAIGLSLAFGVMELINVAHGDLIILGSFLAFTFWKAGVNPVLSLPLVIAMGGLIGYVLQRYLVNRIIGGPPLATLVFFFGIAIALPNIYIMVWGPYSKSITTPEFSKVYDFGVFSLSLAKVYAGIVSILAIVSMLYTFYKTKLGLAMRATIQNREAAMMFGVDVYKVYSLALAIALALATLAGSLIAVTLAFTPVSGAFYTLLTFLIVVLGGMGYLMGSVIAGILMGLVQSFVATYLGSSYVYAIMFLMLYIILLVSPRGILGRGV